MNASSDHLPQNFKDSEDGFLDNDRDAFDAVGDLGAVDDGYS